MSSDPSFERLNQRFEEIFGHSAFIQQTPTSIPQQKEDLLSMTGPKGLNKKLTRLNNLQIRYDAHLKMMKEYNNPADVQKHLESKQYKNLETEIKILIMNILNKHGNDMPISEKKEFEKNTSKFLSNLNKARTCKLGSKESCVISGGKRRRRRTTNRKQRKTRKTRKNKRVRRKRYKSK